MTCHPACTDKLSNTCVPVINVDMLPLAKRRRKGNNRPPKDHASSENEKSDEATEAEVAPINIDLNESMDSEQPSAKKKQKVDKSSPVTSKKLSKQQKFSKKTHKGGSRVEEQGASSTDMTDTDLSDTITVQPPAKKQRKDKKGQGGEAKQSKKSHTDMVDVRVKREEEDDDVVLLVESVPEGQLIKMDKVTSLW